MSTRDLIDAIESGNSSAIQQHFQDAIMSRVAERLDTMRIETAKNMFKSPVNEAWDNYTVHWSSPNSDRVNKSIVYGPSDDHEKMKAHLNANQFNVGKIHKVELYTGKVAASSDPKSHRSYVESVELDESADDDYIHQVLADNDINSQISGNVVHVDHDDVEKAQELVKYHGYDHKVIGGLNEAKKLIGTYDNGNHTAKVYHLSGEHDEGDPYHVKLFKDGKHYEPADYFTNDKDDAHSTAKDMVRRGARNESVELDETSCGTKKKWGAIKDSMKDSVKK